MYSPTLRKHASRAVVLLLLRLGESEVACDMYLENRADALRRDLRKVKMEGSTELSTLKLSRLFFRAIQATCTEFSKLFSSPARSGSCVCCALGSVYWTSHLTNCCCFSLPWCSVRSVGAQGTRPLCRDPQPPGVAHVDVQLSHDGRMRPPRCPSLSAGLLSVALQTLGSRENLSEW